MKTVNFAQGSESWHAHRSKHFNASDAPAMMGLSSYKTRSQLLHEMATGHTPDIDAGTQKLFDDGHNFEALARPIAESIIGDDLFPVVGTLEVDGLPLSASFDGITMDESVAFEHKSLNKTLAESLQNGVIPEQYQVQMEQQLLISGAEKCLFMASKGTAETALHAWYHSDPKVREALLSGWKQFREDLANYRPTEAAPVVVASPIMQLPTLFVELTGRVESSNLALFKSTALEMIAGISTELTTDQHFADAKERVKNLKEGEEELERCKRAALAKTASIEELFQTMDYIRETMRQKRLELDKLVTKREEAIRIELIQKAQASLAEYVAGKNRGLDIPCMPAIASNFPGVIKSKRTIASIEDALNTELARCKIEAGAIADKIHANLQTLKPVATEYPTLFPDMAQVAQKSPEDVANLIASRVAAHKEAEAKRAEAKRLADEAAAAKAAEAQPVVAPAPAAAPVASLPPASAPHIAAAPRAKDPDEVLNTIANMVRAMSAAEQIEVLNFAIAVTTRRSKAA